MQAVPITYTTYWAMRIVLVSCLVQWAMQAVPITCLVQWAMHAVPVTRSLIHISEPTRPWWAGGGARRGGQVTECVWKKDGVKHAERRT